MSTPISLFTPAIGVLGAAIIDHEDQWAEETSLLQLAFRAWALRILQNALDHLIAEYEFQSQSGRPTSLGDVDHIAYRRVNPSSIPERDLCA